MGILSRASYVIRSKINAVLNRAEDPSETLDYSYERLRDELQDVKKGIADLTTQKKRLEIQKRRLDGLSRLLVVLLDVLLEAALLDLQAFLLGRQVRDADRKSVV